MKINIFNRTVDENIRDLATLCLIGILAGHMLPIPIVVYRVIFVLLCVFVSYKERAHLLPIEKIIIIFVSIWFLYYLFDLLIKSPSISRIGAILATMPACILFRYLGRKGVITEKWINVSLILFLIAGMFFYRYSYIREIERMMLNADDQYGITNNASSVFLGLVAFLLLSKNRVVQWVSLFVCWFFLLTAAKRSNILGASLPTLLFIWQYFKGIRTSWWNMIFLIVGFGFAVKYGFAWYDYNSHLAYKMEMTLSGDSNGRDGIYSYFLDLWLNSPFHRLFFGYGFDGTVEAGTIKMHAHSDFVETLVDLGIVGITLFVSFFILLLKYAIKKTEYHYVFISVFFMALVKSFFSMGFLDPQNMFLYGTLGILLSRIKYKSVRGNQYTING